MDEENKNLPVPEDPEGPEEAKEPEKLENIVYDWARSLAARASPSAARMAVLRWVSALTTF